MFLKRMVLLSTYQVSEIVCISVKRSGHHFGFESQNGLLQGSVAQLAIYLKSSRAAPLLSRFNFLISGFDHQI